MKIIICLVAIQLLFVTNEPRLDQWAKPIELKGVENLYKINDFIYRSRQPTKEGFANLEKLGIKKVINLRNLWSDKDELKGSGIRYYYQAKVNSGHIKDLDVIKVLRILKDTVSGPFLIHCHHGADRTGIMCAMYRIVFQGWSRKDALDELRNGGFGFHEIWKNIPQYILNADVEYIRSEVLKP
jgi:protein tyrosine/serine phosphatase